VSLRRGGRQWAGPANPLGQYLYETYVEADYRPFLRDLGSRIGDEGVFPQHTAGPYAHYTAANSTRTCIDDVSFCKANMSAAQPRRRSIVPSVDRVWTSGRGPAAEGGGGGGARADGSGDSQSCVVMMRGVLPAEAHANAGAPTTVVTQLTVSPNSGGGVGAIILDWDVVQVSHCAYSYLGTTTQCTYFDTPRSRAGRQAPDSAAGGLLLHVQSSRDGHGRR
jgi:hypothetical protein